MVCQSKERTAYFVSDEANDKRAYALVGSSNEAINKLSTEVYFNTKAVETMVNLLDARKG